MTEGADAQSTTQQGEFEAAVAPTATVEQQDFLVRISPTERVQLRVLLSYFDKDCKSCSLGVVAFTPTGGKLQRQVCACCVKGFRKATREEKTPQVIRVANGSNVRQVEFLERDLEKAQASLGERERLHAAAISQLKHEATAAKTASDAAAHRRLETAVRAASLETEIAKLKAALDLAIEDAHKCAEYSSRSLATSEALTAEVAKQERDFERNTEGARKDLEKLQRRLNLARARRGIPDPNAEAILAKHSNGTP